MYIQDFYLERLHIFIFNGGPYFYTELRDPHFYKGIPIFIVNIGTPGLHFKENMGTWGPQFRGSPFLCDTGIWLKTLTVKYWVEPGPW